MIKQKEEKLEALRAKQSKIFDQAGENLDLSKVTEISGTDVEKAAVIRKINDDMGVIGKEIGDLREIVGIRERSKQNDEAALELARKGIHPTKKNEDQDEYAANSKKSLGQLFVESGAHKKESRERSFELKTDFTRSAGWAPESLRTGKLVDFAVRPVSFLDIVPHERTSMAVVKYMEETTLTDTNVVEKAEGAAYGESAMALTERSVTVEKLPVYLPVTDEQLEDVDQAQSYIDNRLPAQLLRRADYQGINGTGVTPFMLGILNKPSIQGTAAVAGDGIADTIMRGIKDVRLTGRAIASAIVLHPTDFMTERLRKSLQGEYIWGNPGDGAISQMWGLPIAQSDALAQGSAIVGDFRVYSAYVERRGVVVKVGYVNDDFIKGRQAIRADMRGCFVWYRPAAFSLVTLPA